MQARSHTLFHFTKNLDTLKSILQNGFWPRYCLEDFSWYNMNMNFIAYPLVSFCDIPLSRIDEHVAFYGEYGLGLTKEWARVNRLNPVVYLSDSTVVRDSLLRLFRNHEKGNFYDESALDLNFLLSCIKPVEGDMWIGGKPVKKEFYQENEWRYVPSNLEIQQWIDKETYNDAAKLETYNEVAKKGKIDISPSDIKYIFVKTDTDIPEIIDFINRSLGHNSGNDLKILLSRVISLESINRDL